MRDRKTLQKFCIQDLNDSRNMYNEKTPELHLLQLWTLSTNRELQEKMKRYTSHQG